MRNARGVKLYECQLRTIVVASAIFLTIDILKRTQRAPRPALAQASDAGRGTLCVTSDTFLAIDVCMRVYVRCTFATGGARAF